ncbi:DUF4157 domain-containing protein, partial [Kitasatospora sp. NPDC056327]|uniref:eCIS core domain-containing protein n=1 Tax=Kitasatospora sp. NPDC056327 TaxID=3345785 RepID=UPI0035D705F8
MTRTTAVRDSAPGSTPGSTPGTEPGAARRRTRAPRARTPEPREIVSGAGQPLDPGLRRELEARLGHDLGRVRVHTDRDSAALAELLGADAVAVGPDLFFGEGKYRPTAEDGRRLLAHELLHTVQAPHPLGALRAGRDLGAVSLAQDAAEREAEHGARGEGPAPATPGATPGWLRYATVDADRFRTERLDPATLVDRLAAGILRSLRGDPTDASGRVRLQLARFAPELQASVLARLADRLPSSDHTRLLELVEAAEHRPADQDSARTPAPVTEGTGPATGQEPEENGEPAQESDRPDGAQGRPGRSPEQDGATGDEDHPAHQDQDQDRQENQEQAQEKAQAQEQEQEETRPAPPEESTAAPDATGAAPGAVPEEPAPADGTAPPVAGPATGAADAGPPDAAAQPSDGTTPREPAAVPPQQPAPAEPGRLEAIAQAPDSPLAQHGLLEGDRQQDGVRDEERPLGLEPGADAEVHDTPGADRDRPPEPTAGDQELRPGDFLPSSDPDLSAVPTLDRTSPSADGPPAGSAGAPALPEPPATRADRVEGERGNGPDGDAEPAAPPGTAPRAAEPPDAEDPDAEDREEPGLRPERPVAQEIGPDPFQAPARAAGPAAPESPQERPERPEQEEQPEAPAAEPREAEPASSSGPTTAEPAEPEPEPEPERTAAPTAPGPVGGDGPDSAPGVATGAAPDSAPGTAPDAEPSAAAPGPAAEQADAPAGPGAGPAPDASLESGGGACAGPQQPTTEAEPDGAGGAGGGACGTGGAAGAAPAERAEEPAPPDVSAQDPQAALATAGSLRPDRMAVALDGVDGSVDRTVGERHARLRADPPSVRRPSGAPDTWSG